MRLLIEVFERENGGYVAVACHENSLVQNGSVAAHLTPLGAVLTAVEGLELESNPRDPIPAEKPSDRVILENAIDTKEAVRVNYRDATGAFSSRIFSPNAIHEHRVGGWDETKNEYRTFLLSRIESVEEI